jgi:sugar phosphate isomerase/epimerase
MQIGISTSFNYKIPLKDSLKAISEAGFNFVSIGGNQRHSRYNQPDGRRKIRELVESFGLKIDSIHAPYDPTCDLTQPEEVFYRGAMIEIKRAIDAAAELSAPNLILHLSSFRPSKIPQRIARIKSSFAEIVQYAESKKVVIALENLDYDSEVLFKYAMDLFDSASLRFCYDNGHEMLYNGGLELLKRYSDRLAVIHLHDNDGQKDLHLIPFEGKLNMPSLAGQLNKLAKIPDMTLECEIDNTAYASSADFLRSAFENGMRFIKMLKH